MNKLFTIKTFGCQMNEHDSEKMASLLASRGYQPTENQDRADFILFNTCTVRQKAHDKAFSEIGRVYSLARSESALAKVRGSVYSTPQNLRFCFAARQSRALTPLHPDNPQRGIATWTKPIVKPRPIIGVCGCMAQEEGAKLLLRFPQIDMIFGPDQIYQLPALLEVVETTGKPVVATELINCSEDYHFLDEVSAIRLNGPCAYVTIMKGCNSHCSYCIVPKVRGTEVYRKPREIIREIEALVEKGCLEVTLLGQNVNSYPNFPGLIELIGENTGVERIRFTSPHPKDVKDDLIEEYATNRKLCPHIHLPLQSGSDSVLRRMRRAYNTRQYLAKVEKLRKVRADIAITTDMIVGFPDETDEEFEETLQIVKNIRFDNMFFFKYSPRPGTQAFETPDTVPQLVKEERLGSLQALQTQISKEINGHLIGSNQEVLVEGEDRRLSGKWRGRTSHNKIVNFTGKEASIGVIVKIEVTKTSPNSLSGELVEPWKEG